MIEVGARYRHFKGGVYIAVGIAEHSEDGKSLVVYHQLGKPSKLWARPIEMWNERVLYKGLEFSRFTKIEKEE